MTKNDDSSFPFGKTVGITEEKRTACACARITNVHQVPPVSLIGHSWNF